MKAIERQMLASPDQQISLTDPDARSMATSGRGSGMVGYNVQTAVDTEHHLIVAHEVTNVGTDRSQLANMAKQAKAVTGAENLEPSPIAATSRARRSWRARQAGITVTLPKPKTSGAKSEGRFGKQDFRYRDRARTSTLSRRREADLSLTTEEDGQNLRRYWTSVCGRLPDQGSMHERAKQRRITRWEHEHVVEAVQTRLNADPQAMRVRRETVEHPFGTLKMRMGATHFLMKTTAERRHGNGAARARLQPHPRDEYHRRQGH